MKLEATIIIIFNFCKTLCFFLSHFTRFRGNEDQTEDGCAIFSNYEHMVRRICKFFPTFDIVSLIFKNSSANQNKTIQLISEKQRIISEIERKTKAKKWDFLLLLLFKQTIIMCTHVTNVFSIYYMTPLTIPFAWWNDQIFLFFFFFVFWSNSDLIICFRVFHWKNSCGLH